MRIVTGNKNGACTCKLLYAILKKIQLTYQCPQAKNSNEKKSYISTRDIDKGRGLNVDFLNRQGGYGNRPMTKP